MSPSGHDKPQRVTKKTSMLTHPRSLRSQIVSGTVNVRRTADRSQQIHSRVYYCGSANQSALTGALGAPIIQLKGHRMLRINSQDAQGCVVRLAPLTQVVTSLNDRKIY